MRIFRSTLALAGVLAMAGCSENNDVLTFLVTYTAEATGQSTVNSVTYQEPSGPVTVNNPAPGWSVTLQMVSGDDVGITGDGTAQSGLIRVTVTAETSGRSPFTLRDECVDASGNATPCTVAAGPQQLPTP